MQKQEKSIIALRYLPLHSLGEEMGREMSYFFKDTKRQKEALKLINDIKNFDTGSFMISGFRGSGKTSFVNYVISLLNDPNFVVVKMTLSHKCEAKDFVLRLLRRLRDTLYENDLFRVKIENNKDCKETIDTAYLKTFCEIQSIVNEGLREAAKEAAIKKTKFGIRAGLMSILGIETGINKETLREAGETKTSEDTLKFGFLGYDYELAEYEFRNIISKLTQPKGLFKKVIFITDEMDKLEYGEAIEILKNMRTLLFTKNTIFVLVGSKRFNDEWREAKAFHKDTPLDSLFTRVIYIPLMTIEETEQIYRKIRVNGEFFDIERIILHHLIFKSGGSPRDFFRYLREISEWKDNGQIVIHVPVDLPKEYHQLCMLHTHLTDLIKRFVGKDISREDVPVEYIEAKERFALTLFEDLLFSHGFVFTLDDISSSFAYREYSQKAFREGFVEPEEILGEMIKLLENSNDIITKRGKYYFMKEPSLAERAKKEKIAKIGRSEAEAFAKRTLLGLLESLPSGEKEKFMSKTIKDLLP